MVSNHASFPFNESRHDSYPQFQRSSQGTRGQQTRSHRQKKTTHFKSLALLKQARLTRPRSIRFPRIAYLGKYHTHALKSHFRLQKNSKIISSFASKCILNVPDYLDRNSAKNYAFIFRNFYLWHKLWLFQYLKSGLEILLKGNKTKTMHRLMRN